LSVSPPIRGTNGLYGYEEDDDFVVNDDVVDPELEADAGGFFVHNPVKALASHPVEFVFLLSRLHCPESPLSR
jgi:hypothetical protein